MYNTLNKVYVLATLIYDNTSTSIILQIVENPQGRGKKVLKFSLVPWAS